MGKLTKVIGLSVLGILFIAGTSFAGYLENNGYTNNITIYDGRSSGTGWWGAQEDQEVEPGALANQDWDLEGFFQSGSLLALVGGWDFVSGDPNYPNIDSGDIFFDTDGNGSFNYGTPPDYGEIPDYVLDMDWDNRSYSVYRLDKEPEIDFTQNPGAVNLNLPWLYKSGGTELSSGNGFLGFPIGLSDELMGGNFLGDTHNAVVVDLSFLTGEIGAENGFTSHFTMRCGNDVINGSGSAPVPEPATMLLLGTGLIGLAGIGRKKLMGKKLTK